MHLGNEQDPRAGWFTNVDAPTTKCRACTRPGNNVDLPGRDLKQSELGCPASKLLPTGLHRSIREALSRRMTSDTSPCIVSLVDQPRIVAEAIWEELECPF
ncbi:MAG: hypothetical protein IPK59_20500 [Rhodospirillaceae bacterium]|nr:hypothetical protein [Rhodospirillaceae bacterium]